MTHQHQKLGITFAEFGALLGTREMLKLDLITNADCPLPLEQAHVLNMNTTVSVYDCGSIGCLGGHMALIMGLSAGQADAYVTNGRCRKHGGAVASPALHDLFYPSDIYDWEGITPAMAIDAIDNFLKDGNPHWDDVAHTHDYKGVSESGRLKRRSEGAIT